jgi:hypothetical protein
MQDDLWNAVSLDSWRTIPVTRDRVATESDAKAGSATFYLNASEIGACPYPISLPHPAIHIDEETGIRTPIFIIQAEQADEKVYLGYRFLQPGNGLCLLSEVELLDEPNSEFIQNTA